MNADDQMARDHGRDMFSDRRLRELEEAIENAFLCSRVRRTKLAADLGAIQMKVREVRAQIVRAWD